MTTARISGLTPEEEEFLKKSNHKPKAEGEVFIDVHGNTHRVAPGKSSGQKTTSHTPGAVNYITSSDRVNHRFATTNETTYGDGRRSRSNSPGRVPIHHRKGSDSPGRKGSRDSSPARSGSRGGSPAGTRRPREGTSKQAEEMVAKMLEASIDRVHK